MIYVYSILRIMLSEYACLVITIAMHHRIVYTCMNITVIRSHKIIHGFSFRLILHGDQQYVLRTQSLR